MDTYLKNEERYRSLIRRFVVNEVDAESFTREYMEVWKIDRDAQWLEIEKGAAISEAEKKLCRWLDQIFTACDSYHPEPEEGFDIDEKQLWTEVSEVYAQQWGAL